MCYNAYLWGNEGFGGPYREEEEEEEVRRVVEEVRDKLGKQDSQG